MWACPRQCHQFWPRTHAISVTSSIPANPYSLLNALVDACRRFQSTANDASLAPVHPFFIVVAVLLYFYLYMHAYIYNLSNKLIEGHVSLVDTCTLAMVCHGWLERLCVLCARVGLDKTKRIGTNQSNDLE